MYDAELADGRNQVDVKLDPRQAGFFSEHPAFHFTPMFHIAPTYYMIYLWFVAPMHQLLHGVRWCVIYETLLE